MPEIEVVARCRDALGECPVWDAAARRLLWTDIFGKRLHALDPATGAVATTDLPCSIHSFGLRKAGGLIAANGVGLCRVDLGATTRVEQLWLLPQETGPFFLNDGRPDRSGRYWAGSVCTTYDLPGAQLFRFAGEQRADASAPGLLASNGLAFSPDDRTLYYADSVVGVVWSFDFDLDDGALRNRRVFAKVTRPDGAAVDADGCYWTTSFGFGEVVRFTPDGRLDRRISLPATQVSMCAFGGLRLDTLYVTSGTFRLTPEQEREQEFAGALFAISGLSTVGIAEPLVGW